MSDPRVHDREVNRVLRTWLREDRHEDATRVLQTVLDDVATAPRRRTTWWPARRTPTMNRFATLGLGAAAVVAVLLIGFQLLGSPAPGGPGANPSAEPSAAVEPSAAEPSVAPSAQPSWQDSALRCCAQGDIMPVPAGPFVAWDEVHGGWNVTVTIPGPGWSGAESHALIYGNNLGDSLDQPDGAGLLVFQGADVPPDPCAWLADPSVDTLKTVDGYVAAFAGQASRNASQPVDVAVAGHPGKAITLHVPDDAVLSDCEQGAFVTLLGKSFGDPVPWPDRYAQGPGQIDEFWIVDVGGHVVMFDITYGTQTPQGVIDQLRAMVASTTFGARFQ